MPKESRGGIGTVPVVLFVVLVVVGSSILAVAWQDAPKVTQRYTVVDTNGILEALLASTVDEARYTDGNGRTHIYTGWTVQELIVEDLELRINQTMNANTTGLATGIEAAIGKNLQGLARPHHYNLKAAFAESFFRVKDQAIEGSARANLQVHMRSYESNAVVYLSLTE
jgi:hypothetical protein